MTSREQRRFAKLRALRAYALRASGLTLAQIGDMIQRRDGLPGRLGKAQLSCIVRQGANIVFRWHLARRRATPAKAWPYLPDFYRSKALHTP